MYLILWYMDVTSTVGGGGGGRKANEIIPSK